ncbi:MAG: DUF4381 family protein [Phycisphaerae bacterium]
MARQDAKRTGVGHGARLVRAAAALSLLAGASAGCRHPGGGSSPTTQPAGQPVEKSAERGPVKVTVRLNRDRMTIADPVQVTITAVALPQVEVRMPKFGSPLPGFSVRDFREHSPAEGEATPTWRQEYRLESFLSGEFELPAIEVKFSDRRGAAGGGDGAAGATSRPTIESAVRVSGVKLTVESLLSGQFDPQKFNDLKQPATLPLPARYRAALWAGGAAAVLLAAGGLAWWRRRRAAAETRVQMPPHQWALLELERLVAEDLLSAGQVTEFYYRLNGLLRRYIELRFGLAAAEQTSEEFIRALEHDGRLAGQYKPMLRQFVAACDPVKYARHLPGKAEIEEVFGAARDFIVSTGQREREVELATVERAA